MDITGAGIDITQIVKLTTQVATTGSLRMAELVTDEIFEYTIAVVIVAG